MLGKVSALVRKAILSGLAVRLGILAMLRYGLVHTLLAVLLMLIVLRMRLLSMLGVLMLTLSQVAVPGCCHAVAGVLRGGSFRLRGVLGLVVLRRCGFAG